MFLSSLWVSSTLSVNSSPLGWASRVLKVLSASHVDPKRIISHKLTSANTPLCLDFALSIAFTSSEFRSTSPRSFDFFFGGSPGLEDFELLRLPSGWRLATVPGEDDEELSEIIGEKETHTERYESIRLLN